MVVRVHVQAQTRTECVVAPDYPLDDLLPAVSLTESEQLALALTSAIFQVVQEIFFFNDLSRLDALFATAA